MTGFLDLARELRDEIYTYYAAHDGGFVYDPQTRKLRTSEGHSIDIALMRTCKQIAQELLPIILEVNSVTFKTGSIDRAMSDRARYFTALLMHLHEMTARILFRIRELITDDLASRAEDECPDAGPVLHYLRTSEWTKFYIG
jgi:hypothetical protein